MKKELGIHIFRDLLEHFPFRHIDKTIIHLIKDIHPLSEYIQLNAKVISLDMIGDKRARRLVAMVKDASGTLEVVWFQGISWVEKSIVVGQVYLFYGRVSFYQGKAQLTHPEFEEVTNEKNDGKNFLEPVYPSTEKLKARGLGGRQLARFTRVLFQMLSERDVPENLPAKIIQALELETRYQALCSLHFPATIQAHEAGVRRFKFEELF